MKIAAETKVGILAIVSIAILVIGYSFLKGNDVFTKENTYYTMYDRVEGLSVSKPILVNGYQIGRVSNMTLLSSGKILTEFKVHKDYVVPENTIARIASTDFLGSKAIVFDLGDSNIAALNGDTLGGGINQNILDQIEPVQKKAEAVILIIDSILTSVNNTITPEFQVNVNRSIASIANTLNTLENTSKQVDGLVGLEKSKISNILTNVESIANNFKNNNERISMIFNNIENVSDQVAKANFTQTIDNANSAIADFQSIIDGINQGNGSIGKLLNDDNLYTNLEDASKNLDELIIDLKQNPNRYVHFSIFGRRN
ncbi:MAG TPA: MlaD family protein [Sphingobacteriaceae bacterium]|nr:MlaD family protein [Sphingobacteriaceae bacterium]